MRWNGTEDPDSKPTVFVGKGVCFDTGGISIKPAENMEDMKWDMGGAGAVAGAMLALALRKAKANVIGIIGLVENMVDGNAQRPGDIVKAMNGMTIEVLNTDAEGRLVLADALHYCRTKFEPKLMVNLATLTGAIMIALGQSHAGLFSNDDELSANLTAAGLATGEKLWRMPMGPDYDKLIDTPNADMKNIGGRYGGAITAAQFLQRFVNSVPWAHLDVAGTAMDGVRSSINQSWGSGWGVRLLDRLARLVKTDRESRESLTAELEQLHRAVDRLPDGLVVLDRYDHVQWCNDAAQELHGIVGTGRPLHHFIRQPEFVNYLDGDDYSRPPVLPLPTRPGRLYELRLHRSDEHHKLLISRDLTEPARLDAMRRDFVANVSHEIRTPVTVIGGFAETLLELELPPESQREYLTTIVKQSQTMQRLVEDLLTLATLESSSAPPESERIDVHAMIRAVGSEAQALSQGRHTITYRLDGPPMVLASPVELESALRNLAINAVRYTPDNGRIEIGWRIVDNEGRLRLARGQTLGDAQILSMDYLVKGVQAKPLR